MANVIGVRFRDIGKIYFFDPLDIAVEPGDGVIVETVHGQEYGEVIAGPRQVADEEVVTPLKPVVRAATPEDTRMMEENRQKEAEAYRICAEQIQKHGLDMKLVSVEYAYDGSKIVFSFTSEERVDFRKLVKDLAGIFHTRIQLRQIGVRDEAKLLGGIGPCGQPVCCKRYMGDFHPVSIKMAKEQGLSLNPVKISGLCSRLMCCLQYEQNHYEETSRTMPKIGSRVIVPEGEGTVQKHLILKNQVTVKFTREDGSIELRDYPIDEIGKDHREAPAEAEEISLREFSDRLDQFSTSSGTLRANGANGVNPRRRREHTRQEQTEPEAASGEKQEGKTGGRSRRRRRGGEGKRREQALSASPQGAPSPAGETADGTKKRPHRHRGGRGRHGRGGEKKPEAAPQA